MVQFQDEIDWKDLFHKPEKLFGYSYLYFFGVLVLIGLLYVNRLTDVGKNSVAAVVLGDSTAFVADIPLQAPRTIPPIDPTVAGVSSPDALAKGRDLYKANCASCHGDNGQGDGPAGLFMNPRPRNFQVLTGWTNGPKISEMYKTLEEGIVRNGMASYNYLPPADRFALIHYVQTFTSGYPKDSPDALKALDAAYQLSRGMSVPGQMPVRKAAVLVASETPPILDRLKMLKAAPESQPGVALFRRVTRDESRALTSMLHLGKSSTVESFMKAITSDPNAAGFKAEVARLSDSEWTALHQFALAAAR